MRYLSLVSLVLGVILLQTMPYNPLLWRGVKPDFFLLVIVYVNLFVPKFASIWSGFLGGLLEDLLSGGPLGGAVLTKTISGYGVFLLGDKVVLDNPLVQAALVLVISLCETSLRFFLLDFLGIIHLGLGVCVSLMIPQILLTTFVAPPFFWLLRQAQRRWIKI